MVQGRLIGASFLLAMSASLAAFPPSEPRGTEMRSLLDDLAPDATAHAPRSAGIWHYLVSLVSSPEESERCASTSLKTLAAAEIDFRGCDGGWNHVADFWTADIAGLYAMTSKEAPANDRTGCHVNDFWTADIVGLYTLTSASGVVDPNDPTIKLIELSIASADEEDP